MGNAAEAGCGEVWEWDVEGELNTAWFNVFISQYLY